jgi:hypothetical protein
MTLMRLTSAALVWCAASSLTWAATPSSVIYRCPGNVISNELDARQAKQLGCQVLKLAHVTVLPAQILPALPATPVSSASAASAAAVVSSPVAAPVAPRRVTVLATEPGRAGVRVAASEQRSRDSDAFNILSSELKRELANLASLRQRPADASIAAAIARSAADIAALERELARHPVKTLR